MGTEYHPTRKSGYTPPARSLKTPRPGGGTRAELAYVARKAPHSGKSNCKEALR